MKYVYRVESENALMLPWPEYFTSNKTAIEFVCICIEQFVDGGEYSQRMSSGGGTQTFGIYFDGEWCCDITVNQICVRKTLGG